MPTLFLTCLLFIFVSCSDHITKGNNSSSSVIDRTTKPKPIKVEECKHSEKGDTTAYSMEQKRIVKNARTYMREKGITYTQLKERICILRYNTDESGVFRKEEITFWGVRYQPIDHDREAEGCEMRFNYPSGKFFSFDINQPTSVCNVSAPDNCRWEAFKWLRDDQKLKVFSNCSPEQKVGLFLQQSVPSLEQSFRIHDTRYDLTGSITAADDNIILAIVEAIEWSFDIIDDWSIEIRDRWRIDLLFDLLYQIEIEGDRAISKNKAILDRLEKAIARIKVSSAKRYAAHRLEEIKVGMRIPFTPSFSLFGTIGGHTLSTLKKRSWP